MAKAEIIEIPGEGWVYERRTELERRNAVLFLSRYISALDDKSRNPSRQVNPQIFLNNAETLCRDALRKGQMEMHEVENFAQLIEDTQNYFNVPRSRHIIRGDFGLDNEGLGPVPGDEGLSESEQDSAAGFNQLREQALLRASKEKTEDIMRSDNHLRPTRENDAAIVFRILISSYLRIGAMNANVEIAKRQLLEDLKMAPDQLGNLNSVEDVVYQYVSFRERKTKQFQHVAA